MEEKLQLEMEHILMQKKHELELAAERLEALSPVKKLSQGYSFVADREGHGIRDVSKVHPGETLDIYMLNGKVTAEVTKVQPSSSDILRTINTG